MAAVGARVASSREHTQHNVYDPPKFPRTSLSPAAHTRHPLPSRLLCATRTVCGAAVPCRPIGTGGSCRRRSRERARARPETRGRGIPFFYFVFSVFFFYASRVLFFTSAGREIAQKRIARRTSVRCAHGIRVQ